jgi:hypothetical protein
VWQVPLLQISIRVTLRSSRGALGEVEVRSKSAWGVGAEIAEGEESKSDVVEAAAGAAGPGCSALVAEPRDLRH